MRLRNHSPLPCIPRRSRPSLNLRTEAVSQRKGTYQHRLHDLYKRDVFRSAGSVEAESILVSDAVRVQSPRMEVDLNTERLVSKSGTELELSSSLASFFVLVKKCGRERKYEHRNG